MEERFFETIRLLPRRDLEALALRATLRMREAQGEVDSGRLFSAMLMGFMLGALVASVAFLVGSSLS